ncbi:two-component hybrid sensor and regulator [Cellvibrio sp. BR]|uniref:PAS domain-containing protein n=1 Tax=Cellvibrio sp. BR TaxID=1134474 RepID=UPI000260089C|nr:PAS domain-containing protein [Cellvibrio sp. BR]EIK45499.1 two-component hybrid sensor and regulator [Cellvibrio sp. BR]
MIEHISFSPSLQTSNDIELLRETVGRFQRIFNGSGYGFWEWNLHTQHIEWSGGVWERLGYGAEDAESISDAGQVLMYMHPDDRDYAIEAARQHLRTGRPLDVSYRIRTKSGDYIWTQVRADSLRDEQGHATIMSGVNFDITEIKKVEAALRESEARQVRIIQASSDGIWEWYADRGGFHFSHRCWELLGYDDLDDVLTEGEDRLKIWRKHIFPQDLPIFDNALIEHMAGRAPFDVEYRLVSQQGDIRWIRGRGRAVFNEKGQPIMMSGSNMDITEIKRAEERVIQAKEQAEQANRAKSEFLSSMSHELRTPLNAILGYTQLFEYDGNLKPQQIENVREIRKAGEHLLQLINDVLDLAKIESGNMTVSLEPVLVSRLISECFTLVQPQADAKGIRLVATVAQFNNTYVVADNVRVKQVLLNLLSNAVKYNHVGGEVEVQLSMQEGQELRISVRDTGRGIPIQRQNEVFQPFNRLSAENSNIEGSGVGLVITKQLVEMMKGKLDFVSAEGVGTTFWIDFPVATEWNDEPIKKLSSNKDYTPATLNVKRRCKVLYVEDNPTNVRLLQQIFDRYPQLELEVAEEAFLGIYKARSLNPDLVILDINLPGMDGYEVLSVLKNDPSIAAVPVIGLSANAMPYDVERGRKAGFFDYLTKPVDIHRLIDVFNKLLHDN